MRAGAHVPGAIANPRPVSEAAVSPQPSAHSQKGVRGHARDTAPIIGIMVGQMLGTSALPLAAIIAAMGVLALALALFKRSLGPIH